MMTSKNAAAVEIPWYDLIPDVPEPPEDALLQNDTTLRLNTIIMSRYANDPSVLVAGPATNVIYDSETPGSVIVPDCYVVFGVPNDRIKTERNSYRVDEWNAVPAFVAEIASPSTARRDLNEKRDIYAQMGVQEYWRFDATGGENYGEPLVGEYLVDGEYRRFELHRESDGTLWARSEVLRVDFYWDGEEGRTAFLMRDADTGEWLNFLDEEREARLAAEDARQAAEDARLAAEARAAELEAEIRRLRGE